MELHKWNSIPWSPFHGSSPIPWNWSGYKNNHISAIIAAIHFKFATKEPKALCFHNLALTFTDISRGQAHIFHHVHDCVKLGSMLEFSMDGSAWPLTWNAILEFPTSCSYRVEFQMRNFTVELHFPRFMLHFFPSTRIVFTCACVGMSSTPLHPKYCLCLSK